MAQILVDYNTNCKPSLLDNEAGNYICTTHF